VLGRPVVGEHGQSLYERAPALIFEIGRGASLLSVNEEWSRLTGLPASAALGAGWGNSIRPEERERLLSLMSSLDRCPAETTFDFQLQLASGAWAPMRAWLRPRMEAGALAGFDGVAIPHRTDTVHAELAAAQEESRLKTRFLAAVSHEIRTPLNGILGVTQLLRSAALPAEAREYLEVLESAGESLLGLVNEVLDLSKIESGRLELQPATFDAAQVVGAAARSFLPLARKKGLALELDLSKSAAGPVRGDPARVRQVVNNLVANAVKFTEVGGVQVRLWRPDPDAAEVRLTVRDTGPGIPPAFRLRLFEPFAQAEGAQRRHGGTGLGLSITRQLARLMGGEVVVESTPGEGATFVTTLPLPREPTPVAEPVPAWRPTPAPRRLKVLLAEDDAVNATMTSALLSHLGHAVELVGDGEAAVRRLREQAFDLVFMDVEMPALDGLEATKVIRRVEQATGKHVPIVALTANAMKGDDLKCLSAGMDAYLPKPVTVQAITDVLSWFGSPD
jgi:signal transduction histidine kinase